MYRGSFLCFTLSVLVHGAALSATARAADEPGEQKTDVLRLSGASSPDELADRIAKRLSTATRSELGRLASVPDCTTAMAAGWERVRRTMPETEQEDAVTPDLLAISRFLGLIEGRLQVPLPKTWEETVKSAVGRGQKTIWFPRWDLVLVERRFTPWSFTRDGDHWLVKNENQLIKLPAEDAMVSNVTVECAGESAYVALYGSQSPYRLFAIDQRKGKIAWSSKVWGTARVFPRGVIVNTSGSDWHVVTMRSTDEMLVVFGFAGVGVYVEAFDRQNGENRCRFSTNYFERVSLRK